MFVTIALVMLTIVLTAWIKASRRKSMVPEPWEELMKQRLQEQSLWSQYDKPTFTRKN